MHRKVTIVAVSSLVSAMLTGGIMFAAFKTFTVPSNPSPSILGVATSKELAIGNKIKSIEKNSDGSFTITYEYIVSNNTDYPIKNVTSKSDLAKSFAPHNFSIVNLTSDKLTLNKPGYDGRTNLNLLKGTDKINSNTEAKIVLTVKLLPKNGSKGPFENNVDVAGIVDGPKDEKKGGSGEQNNSGSNKGNETPGKTDGKDKEKDKEKDEGKGNGTGNTDKDKDKNKDKDKGNGNSNKDKTDNKGNGNNNGEQKEQEQSKTDKVANGSAKVAFMLPEDEVPPTQEVPESYAVDEEKINTDLGEIIGDKKSESLPESTAVVEKKVDNKVVIPPTSSKTTTTDGRVKGISTDEQGRVLAETGFDFLPGIILAVVAIGGVLLLKTTPSNKKFLRKSRD